VGRPADLVWTLTTRASLVLVGCSPLWVSSDTGSYGLGGGFFDQRRQSGLSGGPSLKGECGSWAALQTSLVLFRNGLLWPLWVVVFFGSLPTRASMASVGGFFGQSRQSGLSGGPVFQGEGGSWSALQTSLGLFRHAHFWPRFVLVLFESLPTQAPLASVSGFGQSRQNGLSGGPPF
jgi:hypothetical protein